MKEETLKKGDERVEITITTKHNDFASIEVERLRDDIEVSPEDMRLAKRAFKYAYSEYKKQRIKELDEGDKPLKEKEKKEEEEVDKLSPHHEMIKGAIAKGCTVELSLLAENGAIVGYNPFTHRNGPVEDFHPERFRIDGEVVSLKEELVIQPSVIRRPSTVTDAPVTETVSTGEMSVVEPDLSGTGEEEKEARSSASVIEDDGIIEKKEGDYDAE